MSSPETPDTALQDCVVVPEEKKNKWRGTSIAALVVGLLLVCAGLFSWFEDEDLNNAMVQAGAAQAVHAIVDTDPLCAPYALYAANIIDAAVEARTTSPDALVNSLCDASYMFTSPSTNRLLTAIIQQINAAHKATDSENVYLTKLLFLAKGIREGLCVQGQ